MVVTPSPAMLSRICARFTSGVGDIYIVIENTHGKSELCQLTIIHDDIRLETTVFCRTHTGEVDTVFGFQYFF